MVVLPAYNAAATLERTLAEIPRDVVDDLLLVDDASQDDTVGRGRSAFRTWSTRATAATAATRRPATPRPCAAGRTSS